VVSSAGIDEGINDNFDCTAGGVETPISWRNLAIASAASASSQIAIGTTTLASSGADVGELVLGEEVADVAEMNDVDAVQFHGEGHVAAAFFAAVIVAEGSDAGDQDILDFILARTVETEGLFQAAGDNRAAVPRRPTPGLGQRRIVGMAVGHDVAGDPATRRANHRLIGVGHNDRVFAAHADARPPVPGEFHSGDSCTGPSPAAYRVARSCRPDVPAVLD
jgi:hypothetical protein